MLEKLGLRILREEKMVLYVRMLAKLVEGRLVKIEADKLRMDRMGRIIYCKGGSINYIRRLGQAL